MRRVRTLDRLRYAFDNTMSRGPTALIVWVGLVTLLFVIVVAGLVGFLQRLGLESDAGAAAPLDIFWTTLTHVLDPGTLGNSSGDWPYLLALLVATLGGILIVSGLIGLLSAGIQVRLEELRKGRSVVIEDGHTLILGWAPEIFAIVQQLIVANMNQRRPAIVVLANQDKVAMEDMLAARVGDFKNTRVVCRTGNPAHPADVAIGRPETARSVIVIAPDSELADSLVIKVLLALDRALAAAPRRPRVVTELRDPEHVDVVGLIGRDQLQVVVVGDLIARVAVAASRAAGLSVVYSELLDMEGCEIYLQPEPRLVGRSFEDAIMAYETATVIGLDTPAGLLLNPPLERLITAGDAIVAIAEDDDRVTLAPVPGVPDLAAIAEPVPAEIPTERSLVLGWNQLGAEIIRELDRFVQPGSELVVASGHREPPAAGLAVAERCLNQTVRFVTADPTRRSDLLSLAAEGFDHCIMLAAEELAAEEADARTLATLLHLRTITRQAGATPTIVAQMADLRNRELALASGADDFIVSEHLVSLALAQVSEVPERSRIFAELFDVEGCEIYLRPAADYVEIGRPVDFYTVSASALRRGEIALGYRIARLANSAERAYGVTINPTKSAQVAFEPGDRIVVLARF